MGVDFITDLEQEDIAIDAYGEIKLNKTPISEAIVRRACTPKDGYGRAVRQGNSLITLNLAYGGDLPYILSSPDPSEDEFFMALSSAARDDGRASLIELNAENIDNRSVVNATYAVGENIEIVEIPA